MARPPITASQPYTPRSGLVAGQTFFSERQYRNALARARGFANLYQQQKYPHVVKSAQELQRLRPAARQARERAFKALAEARRSGEPVAKVARIYRVSMSSVQRYVAPALEKRAGRWHAKPQDRLYRQITTLTTEGVKTLDTYNSRTAQLLARYHNAVRQFLRTGNADSLKPFKGKTFRVGKHTYRLETDPKRIKALQEAGALDGAIAYAP
jgi:hypothetical protein